MSWSFYSFAMLRRQVTRQKSRVQSTFLTLTQVDNVAGLYAGKIVSTNVSTLQLTYRTGVRDSVLTNHGVDQANKLGDHLAKTTIVLTHIFASPLTRTSKTAEAIQKAQVAAYPDNASAALDIVKVPELIEQVRHTSARSVVLADWCQDFGYYEGKPFQARSADSKKSGCEQHHDRHKDDAGFVDVESKESMAKRADTFLGQHLLPLFDSESAAENHTVAIVSHGILLSNLWRRLLLRLPRRSLKIAPDVTAARGDIILEHLGGWSNTGYLHLSIQQNSSLASDETEHTAESESPNTVTNISAAGPQVAELTAVSPVAESKALEVASDAATEASPRKTLDGYSTIILAIDNKQHLVGLKHQRGGIGRSAHDESQKKLDGFFKKQRVD
jgi:broad specificity phosphatase PhoE